MKKLCVIYNTAPKYREGIFKAIENSYDCDWYFGETKSDIKEMDTSALKHVTYYSYTESKIKWKRGLLKLLFDKRYGTFIVLAETRCITDYIFLIASRLIPDKKVYIWTHGWYGKENRIEAFMKKVMYKMADGILLYGNYAKELMISKGFKAKKLHVVHNSLDYSHQVELRDKVRSSDIFKCHFNNSNPVLLFIGRLTAVKRLDMLVEAIKKLKDKGESYNLVFVGDGAERKKLESLVSDFQIGNSVWFYGGCYDDTKNAELVYNADLCVAPGNVGLTAMHSMVFGCPVISHNNFKMQMPEFEAIVPGITGGFFEYNNEKSLCDTISAWFKKNADNREEIRRNCYKEIDENWTPEFQMKVIKSII